MRTRTLSLGLAATAGALIAGISVAALNGASAGSESPSGAGFGVNQQGQSYGSALGLTADAAPDLVEAYGDDGQTKGYVKNTDLNPPMAKSPAEAVALEKSASSGGRKVPLVKSDGKTVIGSFTIENSGQPFGSTN